MAPLKKQVTDTAASIKVSRRKKPPLDPNWKPKNKRQALRVANRMALRITAAELLAEITPYDGEYTEEIGSVMAELVADGMTLDALDEFTVLPPKRVVCRWLLDEKHPFHSLYYEAKRLMVPLFEERMQVVASTPMVGKFKTTRGVVTKDGDVIEVVETREADNVERSKLIVSVMQSTLGYLSPRKHGKQAVLSIENGNAALDELLGAFKTRNAEIENG